MPSDPRSRTSLALLAIGVLMIVAGLAVVARDWQRLGRFRAAGLTPVAVGLLVVSQARRSGRQPPA
jgi:hypothetical protein